ncbi:MAG: hypothetical protein JXR96_30015 [Deltaproteobacteria bacterium]|nr:hypothetical protein [Deltaproteobacteria bacterium]
MAKRSTLIAGLVAGLLLVATLLLLLFLRCEPRAEPPAPEETFDYFAAKAAELAFDRERIIRFVQKDLVELPYRGDVKGALGALWDGAGSPEEKLALARALLARCEQGSAEPGLDDVAPGRDKAADPAGQRRYAIAIRHRLLMPQGAAPRESPVYSGPIAALVGRGHTIDVPECGRTRFVVRADPPVTKELSALGGVGEEVIFEIEQPGGERLTVVRELWRADNRTGALFPLKGDRHDFAVLPCRISSRVFEKEQELAEPYRTADLARAEHYLGLLAYCRESDLRLEKIETGLGVRATFQAPRILFLSKYAVPERFGGPAYALDLRLNRAAFAIGGRADAHLAERVRSFHEAGLEHAFLKRWTGRAVSSAFDVLCRIRDDYPNRPETRAKAIAEALRVLAEHCGADGSVAFQALLPDGEAAAEVAVARTAEGRFRVSGGPIAAPLAALLTERGFGLPVEKGKLSGEMEALGDAALTVENGLLASGGPKAVPADYALKTGIDCGREPIFVPGSVYRMRIPEGGTQGVFRFTTTDDNLAFGFKIWNENMEIPGELTITEKARAEAVDYHTKWQKDKLTYDDKVSLIVPRKVHESLVAGQKAAYEQNNSPKTMEPKGKSRATVEVNGKAVALPVLIAVRDGKDFVVLDDAEVPIAGFQYAESISTRVRCRLVDEKGIGIAHARVELVGTGVAQTTWPDGGFRLPPAPDRIYGQVKMRITRHDEPYGEVDVDLSAPGLDTIEVRVPRKRIHFVWIEPGHADEVAALELSAQARRQIRRHLEAGELVAVPDRMRVTPAGETVAFFTYHPPSGHVLAVSEDGLHQSTSGLAGKFATIADAGMKLRGAVKDPKGSAKGLIKDGAKKLAGRLIDQSGLSAEDAAALNSITEWIIESEGKPGMIDTLHFYRGSLAALFGYSRHRIGQDDKTDHALAVESTLAEMEALAMATDLLAGIDELTGGGASEALSKTPWAAVGGASARAAFKLGYLTALKHIDLRFGKP